MSCGTPSVESYTLGYAVRDLVHAIDVVKKTILLENVH
jgi:hypothetical protein